MHKYDTKNSAFHGLSLCFLISSDKYHNNYGSQYANKHNKNFETINAYIYIAYHCKRIQTYIHSFISCINVCMYVIMYVCM